HRRRTHGSHLSIDTKRRLTLKISKSCRHNSAATIRKIVHHITDGIVSEKSIVSRSCRHPNPTQHITFCADIKRSSSWWWILRRRIWSLSCWCLRWSFGCRSRRTSTRTRSTFSHHHRCEDKYCHAHY